MPVSKVLYKSHHVCVPQSSTEDQQQSGMVKVKERGKDRAQTPTILNQSSQQFFPSSSLKVFTSPTFWTTKVSLWYPEIQSSSFLKNSKLCYSFAYLFYAVVKPFSVHKGTNRAGFHMVSGQLFLGQYSLFIFLKYRQNLEAGIPCDQFKSNPRITGLECYLSVLIVCCLIPCCSIHIPIHS